MAKIETQTRHVLVGTNGNIALALDEETYQIAMSGVEEDRAADIYTSGPLSDLIELLASEGLKVADAMETEIHHRNGYRTALFDILDAFGDKKSDARITVGRLHSLVDELAEKGQ